MTTTRPAGKNVLIKALDAEVKFGKLNLPDTAKKKPSDGIVVAIGEWCDQVQPGDWVVYSRKQANDLEIEGMSHVIIDERAILVVIEEEDNE